MRKLTLVIEDQPIDFEIGEAGLYLYYVNSKSYFLDVKEVYKTGCTFRLSDHSSQSYWWEMETRPLCICSLCEDLYEESIAKGGIEDRMREDHLCFGCSQWSIRAEGENPLVIDGMRYSLGTGNSGGMAGRKFVIEYFSGEIVETHDLWCQGEVPEYFREEIPDTAEFLGGAYFDKDVMAWQASR